MNYIKSRLIAKFLEQFHFKDPISEVQHPCCCTVILYRCQRCSTRYIVWETEEVVMPRMSEEQRVLSLVRKASHQVSRQHVFLCTHCSLGFCWGWTAGCQLVSGRGDTECSWAVVQDELHTLHYQREPLPCLVFSSYGFQPVWKLINANCFVFAVYNFIFGFWVHFYNSKF